MEYKDLTAGQKSKIADAKSPEEILKMAKTEGYELTDDEIEGISGGSFWVNEYYCPTTPLRGCLNMLVRTPCPPLGFPSGGMSLSTRILHASRDAGNGAEEQVDVALALLFGQLASLLAQLAKCVHLTERHNVDEG